MILVTGLAAWSLRMASRAGASAAGVPVQVLGTTTSAADAEGAGVQPRSRSWRSMAAPSAWVARQPNCWMWKMGMTEEVYSQPFTVHSEESRRDWARLG